MLAERGEGQKQQQAKKKGMWARSGTHRGQSELMQSSSLAGFRGGGKLAAHLIDRDAEPREGATSQQDPKTLVAVR